MAKKKPDSPDPQETAAASTSTNVGTAIANAFMNNANQVTPDGSINYDQSGTYKWTDPYTGQSYDIPTFTATTTLSPEQQAIKTQTDAAQLNLGTLANQQSGFLTDYMATPVDLSTENVNKYITDHWSDDFNKQYDQQQAALETKLANQGVQPGSEAYNRAMENFLTSRSASYDNMYGDFYQQGVSNLLTQRNQPINEITALLSGSQVSNPTAANFTSSTIPTTDTAGIINQDYQNKLAASQINNSFTNNILGGLFGLGSSFIKASDRRVKRDIRRVGLLDNGLPIYAYRYLGSEGVHIGVMAQEVEAVLPAAVHEIGGVKHVDYGKLAEAL